jgi:hypothetical protein
MLSVKKTRLKRGDVLRLSFDGGAVAAVRVVYVSSYFKQLVLVALFDGANVSDAADVLSKTPLAQFFTGRDSLLPDQGWEQVGSTPPLVTDRASSRRLVAGDVWVEDECLGPADGADQNLPNMLVYGSSILRKKMTDALHG